LETAKVWEYFARNISGLAFDKYYLLNKTSTIPRFLLSFDNEKYPVYKSIPPNLVNIKDSFDDSQITTPFLKITQIPKMWEDANPE
jgi:hypothetical protein